MHPDGGIRVRAFSAPDTKLVDMPRASLKPGPTREEKIYITEEFECRYWMRKLDVTYEELLRAVREVGPMVTDVKRYLETQDSSEKSEDH
jgi:hypothetical protein